jgi:hypothetical protein
MTYCLLTIRSEEDQASNYLYPELGEGSNTVRMLAEDGERPGHCDATNVVVVAKPKDAVPQRLATISNVTAGILVSDCRVAVACSNYVKGNVWLGFGAIGAAVAGAAMTVSAIRAARQRRGKMLVGHIRYEWLAWVQARDRNGAFDVSTLGFLFANPQGQDALVVQITLKNSVAATAVADDIVKRAARYKAANQAESEELRSILNAYAEHPTFRTLDNVTRHYQIPLPFIVPPTANTM